MPEEEEHVELPLKWKAPRKVALHISRREMDSHVSSYLPRFLRAMVYGFLLGLVAYISAVLLTDIRIFTMLELFGIPFLWIPLGWAALSVVIWCLRYLPVEYGMNEKGIARIFLGLGVEIVKWNQIEGFSREPNSEVEGAETIKLSIAGSMRDPIEIYVSKGPLVEQVCSLLSERISASDPASHVLRKRTASEEMILRGTPLVAMGLFCFAFSIVYAYGFARFSMGVAEPTFPLAALLFVLAMGPGTVGAVVLLLCGKLEKSRVALVAISFNLLTSMATGFYMILFMLRLSE